MIRVAAGRISAALAAVLALSIVLLGCSQDDPDTAAAPSTAGVVRSEQFGVFDAATVPGGDDRGLEVPGARITVETTGTAERIHYADAPELADGPVPEEAPPWITAADGEVLFFAELTRTNPTGMPAQPLTAADVEFRLVSGETEVTLLPGTFDATSLLQSSSTRLAVSVPEELIGDLSLEVTVDDHVERLRLTDGVRTHSDAVDRHGFGLEAVVDDVAWQQDIFAGYVSDVVTSPVLGFASGWASDGHTFVGLRVEADASALYNDTSRLTLRLPDGTELESIEGAGDAFEYPGNGTTWFEVPIDADELTVLVRLAGEGSDGTEFEAGPIEVPLRLEG